LREGGVGSRLADEVATAAIAAGAERPPYVRVLGTPQRFLAQGTPAAILHDLGLDSDGLEAEVRRLVGP
jgi:deoxyxylulose-5-phosphate synthase